MIINNEAQTSSDAKILIVGKVGMSLQEMFWGGYFGSCTDKFGVQWMFNCNSKK